MELSSACSSRCFPALFGRTLDTRKRSSRFLSEMTSFIRLSAFPFPYISAVSISVIPAEMPVRRLSISRALAALFSPRNQVPSPKAGTCTPFLNVTVCFILDQTCFFHFFFHLIIRRTFWCWKIW